MSDDHAAEAEGDQGQDQAARRSTVDATSSGSQTPQQQLPALRSYMMKRSKAPLAPSRVKLEAAQLLPKLHHSQPGIGFYGRVRERATSKSVDLWSQQLAIGQQPSLVLGPSSELTTCYYSQTPVLGKKVFATTGCGQYPFSRIVYSNVIGRADEPIGAGEGLPGKGGDLRATHRAAQRSPGAFVMRHKVRQSGSLLSRVLDNSSASSATLRRTMSQIK